MKLENLCDLFDSHEIVDKKDALSKVYVASSSIIYSDGEFDQYVDKDGYVRITNITDAMYIMFLDIEGDLFISIYKYIPETHYKEVIDRMNKIRNQMGMQRHNNIHSDFFVDLEKSSLLETDNTLVDVNNLKCGECGNNMRKKFKKDKDIVAICDTCNLKYLLIPSKYYVIKAKEILYSSISNELDLNNIGGE